MIRIAVCEDEATSLAVLSTMLDRYFALHDTYGLQYESYQDAEQLISRLNAGYRFDLYFLDIYMAPTDGIALAEQVRALDKNAVIVFTTASKDHALDAFRVGATQYLLKPIEPEKLHQVLDNFLRNFMPTAPTLLINSPQGKVAVPHHRIICAEYYQHIVTFTLTDGQKISTKSLRVPFGEAVAELLSSKSFVQSHKSFVVNLAHVRTYTPDKFYLDKDITAPISKSFRAATKSAYLSFNEQTQDTVQ